MATSDPQQVDSGDIAIVGIALRFPGSHGPAEFWANLRAGTDLLRRFSDEELSARGVPARLLRDPAYVKCGHPLEGVDQFDAGFFGISPRDAAIFDPQHRHFLECAWEALEDAGHPPESIRGPIGVYGGSGAGSYFYLNVLTNPDLVESVGLFLLRHTGNDKDFLTTRASYCLDLKGPSINVQTACSTSLVAVHLASQSLILGECDLALAGGVTIELPHALGYLYREGEILSPDGRCRSFDAEARGTVFGSGVGIVALRRLGDALKDGDRIYAIVKGSAVNNDGAGKVSYLAPSVDGQAATVAEALASAGVEADTIDYVEAHGSGTPVGEPIEVAALIQAFGRSTARRHYCGLGSVKANIGHLDTAAGVAGLIKTALSLYHGELPPLPHFRAPNPALPLAGSPFYVLDRLRHWPRGPRPRRAGVNSLGVGGTNAHVVLQEAPREAPSAESHRDWQLLCLSAKSKRSLDASARRLAAHLRTNPAQPLADVAFTLLNGRRGFEHRRVLAVRSHEEGAAMLEALEGQRVFNGAAPSTPASVVFLLPGGGMQHVRMGFDLYESEPFFRAQIDRGIDEFRRRSGHDLRPLWLAPTSARAGALELERPSLQLPAIFILEYALAQFWISLGVRPAALMGHSMGETTAACLAGVLSFEDALGFVALRGELFELMPEGGMLSVPVDADTLRPYLGPDLDIAAINAHDITVAAGPVGAVEDLARRLVAAGIEPRRIPITIAAHSRMVEPILPRFLAYLQGIALHPPTIPFISNCTGTWITAEEAVRPEYWAGHLRGTVRLAEGLSTLLADPARVLLEVGPGRSLSSLARLHPDAGGARGVFATLRHAEERTSDVLQFLTAFGRLWSCGVPVDPAALWHGEARRRVSLPTYAFQHQRHWIEPGRPAESQGTAASEPQRIEGLADGCYRPTWRPTPAVAAPAADAPRTWLVFLDRAGLGEAVAARLRARGDVVTVVRESDDNRRLGDAEYALSPERGREGYDALVRDLTASGRLPDRIVHLWMLTPDESFRPGSNFFDRNQDRGFYSLLFLTQALAAEGTTGPLHLSVVSNGLQAFDGEPLLHPSKATVLGPCRVIPREFPGITCSSIDLPLPVAKSGGRRASRTAIPESLVVALEGELASAPRSATVAYRHGVRHEQEFVRVKLPPPGVNGHSPVRERGVYLITGGLGGLGLLVAADFAKRARARLVLVGRSPLPDRTEWDGWLARHGAQDATSRRITALREIERLGGEVLVACADVADIDAMRGVLEATRRRFGALHGVVHAAGVLRDAPLLTKTQQAVEEVFAAKVHGTLVLDELLADVALDFVVLFSSVSAIVAPPGQVDYVAASAFLDAYARSATGTRRGARRGARARRTLSVDWGVWSEVGMAADLRTASADRATSARSTPRHPLFDCKHADPDAPLVLDANYSPTTRWILDEHRTREGRAVVPGAAYLELARAALAEVDENPRFEIRDLLLLRPLHVADDQSRDVRVELQPDLEGYEFSVSSRSAGTPVNGSPGAREPWETHAEARLVMRAPRASPVLPLEAIEARCASRRRARGSTALAPGQDELVRFGPRWRTLREVRTGPGEALATLELSPSFAQDVEHYGLHPALLDIATTCALELPELSGGATPRAGVWAPVSYKSVRVHATLPPRVKSWVRSRATNSADSPLLVFDVVVADDDGRVCLEIDELAMRRLPSDLGLAAKPSGGGGRNRPELRRSERADLAPSPGRSAFEKNLGRGIASADGMALLQGLLGAADLPQVVATSLDLHGLSAQIDAQSCAPHRSADAPESDDEAAEPADAIERTLAGFWRELLGVRKVGLRDSFFDLGGHSLIAVRLFARIKRTYDVDFPISVLFEAPTIERCADEIRRALHVSVRASSTDGEPLEKRATHLVAMESGRGTSSRIADKTPFFLVAGMFGNVLNLRHLARLLGEDRRVFGLQAAGLYGTQKPHETFEEMATAYLAELRRVQPSGPYLLGGFSGGGLTAQVMATRLIAEGEAVALLALLDTGLPRRNELRAGERALIHWQLLLRRGPVHLVEWLRNKWRWELARLRSRRPAGGEGAIASEFRSEEIGAAFRRALTRHAVPAYPGVVTLFRPKLAVAHVLSPQRVTNAKRELLFGDNGWGAHAERVVVHEVPGDHDSMVLEPNVRVLGARLRACLQEAEVVALQPTTPNSRSRART